MSSYSFQGATRVWTRRDEEENRAIFSAQRQETGVHMPQEFKPVYLANAEYEVEKWSVKQLMRLLRLYGAHRCLWDIRDPDNRNRKMRKAALIDITAAMGGGVQRTQVVQKINVLRATYRYEKRRIKQRIRKGIGAKTKLKWFALADAFLRHMPRAEKSRRVEDADTDSDLEDTVVFTIDPETLIPLDEELDELETPQADDSNAETIVKLENEHHFSDIISNLKRSPVTDTEYFDGHMTDTPQNYAAPIFLKKENFVSPEKMHTTTTKFCHENQKQIWSTKESLQFVRHLRDYPLLWRNEKINHLEQRKGEAVAEIAALMKISRKRIEKRVHAFRRTCHNEKLKMFKNSNYKPDFIWWPEAEAFLQTCGDPAESVSYFVDANAAPPATPLSVKNTTIKSETELDQKIHYNNKELDLENEDTPINPIPSVAPPSVLGVAIEEALDALFHDDSDIRRENVNENEIEQNEIKLELRANDAAQAQSPLLTPTKLAVDGGEVAEVAAPPHTKLIWNGLEDDLLEGKWSLKHSVKFLRLYGAHRCLWDLHDPDYRSRELRSAAVRDIAAAMGYGLDADYVAKKIKIFRITYMQHRKRMLAATKLGKEPEIQLRWFPLADSFLRPHIGLRSIKAQERELPQFDFQYVFANLNLIDPALLTDFRGKGTQNAIEIGGGAVAVRRHDETQAAVENAAASAERLENIV